jgi:hypothetical protein
MKHLAQGPSAFALELHTDHPEEMVQFYKKALGVEFYPTTYPFSRYYAVVGRFALIISDARGCNVETKSDPGKVTIALIASAKIPADERKFFLHHTRPLGSAIPERLAARVQDPDGNYIALAPSLERVLGFLPIFLSLSDLFKNVKEILLIVMTQMLQNVRRHLEIGIDRCEMAVASVTFLKKDLRGYTHFVAAQNGLYAANATSCRRLMRGKFYGLTFKNGDLFAYQAMGEDEPEDNKNGRILRITMKNDRIQSVSVAVKDLDSGCHQIDFVGDDLLVADCHNGCIVQLRLDSPEKRNRYYPLGKISRSSARNESHINSIAGHPDGTIWVLLHNSGRKPSEIMVLNRQFEVVERFSIDAGAAHNIVFTNDGSEYLVADSLGGRVISPNGVVIDGGSGMLMVRGLSLDENTCVVGDSIFGSRPFRRFVPGHVYFYDRHSWKLQSMITVPGAPTDIRRIDGKDLSLSNYFAAHAQEAGLYSRKEPEPVQMV